jgi:hypothetical protein
MLDQHTTNFPAPSLCEHDPGVQRLVVSRQPVPFLQIGDVARIEVVGIPALRCQVCGDQRYNLDVLARIESTLQRHAEQGDWRTSYTFEQLAGASGQQ